MRLRTGSLAVWLLSCALPGAAAEPLGRLDWGRDPGTGDPWTAAALRARVASGKPADEATAATRRVVKRALASLEEKVSVVPRIHSQGLLAGDPRRQASHEALKTVPDVYDWAVCARLADPAAARACWIKAASALDAWAAAYRPDGDPINEGALVPLIMSADLLRRAATPEQRRRRDAWLRELAKAGDALSSSWVFFDAKRVNNWTAWRLLIRGLAAEVLGDEKLKAGTRRLVGRFVSSNILDDGSTTDFHARDALHYHIYDLLPLVELALLAPGLVDAGSAARIQRGVEFMRPYYTGRRRHVEFVHTTVGFDVDRRKAGQKDYDNAPWDPATARPLLDLAAARFPSVAAWAGAPGPDRSPIVEHLAALHAGR